MASLPARAAGKLAHQPGGHMLSCSLITMGEWAGMWGPGLPQITLPLTVLLSGGQGQPATRPAQLLQI